MIMNYMNGQYARDDKDIQYNACGLRITRIEKKERWVAIRDANMD